MNSPTHGSDRLSALASMIGGIESVSIYGRVIEARAERRSEPCVGLFMQSGAASVCW